MNRTPDVELVLREWLADDGDIAPDRVLEVVADRIAGEPRRPVLRLPWRPYMNSQLKLAAGVAAAVIVAFVAWQLLPGRGDFGGQPTPIPSPTASPTGTPIATGPVDLPASGTLPGGRYRIQPFDDPSTLSVVADIPAGWISFGFALGSPGEGTLIGFMEPETLFSDPCHWDLDGTGSDTQAGDVVPGPTVDDLVSALQANTSYTSTAPTAVTFGEFEGQALQLQLPGDDVLLTCDKHGEGSQFSGEAYYVFANGFYAQGPDSLWDLVIVDVDGTRLVVMSSYAAGSTDADIDAARGIVESFEFTP